MEVEELWNSAVELAYSHKYQEALLQIDKALIKAPDSGKCAIEKAEILCELGRTQEALTFLTKGTFTSPELITKEINKIREAISWDKNLSSNKSEHEKLDRLMKWANENGMDTSNIKIVYYSPDFRGVQANRRIRANERIITANSRFLVTTPKILKASPLARKVANCGVNLDYPFATALACMVYEGKGNSGAWEHYIESFPETADTFPYFFTSEEKEYLRGTIWEPNMKSEMDESRREYDEICEKLPEFKKMTAEVYLRLTTLVCSRYFAADKVPGQKLAVPVIDMFNYYVDKVGQTTWNYIPEEDAFVITALKDIRWGEVIALNYGTKPNGRYLLYYGFVPDNNEYMYIFVDPVLRDSDPLLKEKQRLLGYVHNEKFLYCREFYLNWDGCFSENDAVLSLCRFAVFEGDIQKLKVHLEKFDMAVRYKTFRVPPLSKKNEIAALELLKKVLTEKLKTYPSTLEEDKKTLETRKELTFNAKNALIIRIGELRAHVKVIEFADEMIRLLKNPEKAKSTIGKMNTWYTQYAKKSLLPLLIHS